LIKDGAPAHWLVQRGLEWGAVQQVRASARGKARVRVWVRARVRVGASV
jgi:hypothetical protein